MHRFLAAFWLVLASTILFWPYLFPGTPLPFDQPMATRIALFAFVLSGYNLLRWHLARLRARYRREAEPSYMPRPPRREEPPNPDFDFSDGPDKPKSA